MSQTIRERGEKVFQALKEKSVQGIQAIAAATGIPKSSVHRHQQSIVRRNQHPESEWWETEAGGAWLKLLVCGSIFFFGVKHGVGVGELCEDRSYDTWEREIQSWWEQTGWHCHFMVSDRAKALIK